MAVGMYNYNLSVITYRRWSISEHRPPSHFSLWSRVASSSAFSQPTPVHCASLLTQHTVVSRAFSVVVPTVWNPIPDELRDPTRDFDSFGQFLKKNLFLLLWPAY